MGVDGQRHAVATLPREEPGTLCMAGWATRPVWTGAGNFVPIPGFDPRNVQSVVSRYTE
jgi:hypothetical protein